MFVCLFIPANFCCLLSYKRTNGLQIIKALDRLTASGNEFSGPMGYHLSKVDDIELNTDFETLPVGEDLFRYRRSAPSGLRCRGGPKYGEGSNSGKCSCSSGRPVVLFRIEWALATDAGYKIMLRQSLAL